MANKVGPKELARRAQREALYREERERLDERLKGRKPLRSFGDDIAPHLDERPEIPAEKEVMPDRPEEPVHDYKAPPPATSESEPGAGLQPKGETEVGPGITAVETGGKPKRDRAAYMKKYMADKRARAKDGKS